MTINDTISALMSGIRKPNTIQAYRAVLDRFGAVFGDREPSGIMPVEVEAFIKSEWPEVSEGTRYMRFSIIRALFNRAGKEERKRTGKSCRWDNPCDSLEIRRPGAVKKPLRDLDRVEAIRTRLKPRHALIYDLGTVAGMRVSEILGFRVRDLWGAAIRIEAPKSGKAEEHVALSRELAGRLRAYILENGIKGDERVFPYTRQAVWQVFRRRGVAPHDLRRFAASKWARAGRPMVEIQGFLRHASVTTTERYVGSLGVSEVSEIIEKVNGGAANA